MRAKKTQAEIDSNIRFIPTPEWKNVYQYHRTNKRATQVDINKKR
jgi:hypothetical protein